MQNWAWLIWQLTESILVYVNLNSQVTVTVNFIYKQTKKTETRILDLPVFYNFKIFTNVQQDSERTHQHCWISPHVVIATVTID